MTLLWTWSTKNSLSPGLFVFWTKKHILEFDVRYFFSPCHSVWFERDVRRIDFVVIFFQWTQNWTALNFEVNFQPLIQLNSRGSQNNSWKGHWVPLFSQGIRTSEDVRDLKKVEVWFYVLSEVSFLTRAKPQKRIPWVPKFCLLLFIPLSPPISTYFTH